jgi:hypothetical protein
MASSTSTCGFDAPSGKLTMALGMVTGASGSGGHAADDAGAGRTGAALGVGAMQRGGATDAAATASGCALEAGDDVVEAGAGSGGVRLQAAATKHAAATASCEALS